MEVMRTGNPYRISISLEHLKHKLESRRITLPFLAHVDHLILLEVILTALSFRSINSGGANFQPHPQHRNRFLPFGPISCSVFVNFLELLLYRDSILNISFQLLLGDFNPASHRVRNAHEAI